MSQTTDERIHWTTSDIELLPESSNRYEITGSTRKPVEMLVLNFGIGHLRQDLGRQLRLQD
jgi:hypothetical protein